MGMVTWVYILDKANILRKGVDPDILSSAFVAQSAGAAEYTDYISAEG